MEEKDSLKTMMQAMSFQGGPLDSLGPLGVSLLASGSGALPGSAPTNSCGRIRAAFLSSE